MPKVTFLLSNNYINGVTRMVTESARELLKRGYEVDILVPIIPYWQWQKRVRFRKFNIMKRIINIFTLFLRCVFFEFRHTRFRWVAEKDLNLKARRYLFRPADNLLADSDWLFLANSWYQFYDISEKIARGKRIVQIIQDHLDEVADGQTKSLITDAYHNNYFKLTVSSFSANILRSKNIKVDRIINLGINQDYFYPVEPYAQSVKILMYYATHWCKGAHIGMEALGKIKTIFNDIEICLFGPYPPKVIPKGYNTRWSLSEREVGELYRAHSIFVYPSLLDNFPSPPLEAMACGSAVVTTRVGAVEEYAVNMENAVIVEPGKSEALKNAIELLLKDNQLRARISRNAALAASKFTWKNSIDKLEDFFNQSLAAKEGACV